MLKFVHRRRKTKTRKPVRCCWKGFAETAARKLLLLAHRGLMVNTTKKKLLRNGAVSALLLAGVHRAWNQSINGGVSTRISARYGRYFPRSYGAKKPKMSSTRCVGLAGNTLMDPVVVGTIAILLVIAPS